MDTYRLVLFNASILSLAATFPSSYENIVAQSAHVWLLLSSILAFLLCFPGYYSPSTVFGYRSLGDHKKLGIPNAISMTNGGTITSALEKILIVYGQATERAVIERIVACGMRERKALVG
ncbi:hypothetical protein RUND412_003848 [Rhizina undulata]